MWFAAWLALLAHAAFASWPPSSNSGFSDCSSDVGVGLSTPYRVMAAADWDNNQKVDIIAVDAVNPNIMQVWTWNSDVHRFQFAYNATMPSAVVAGTAIDLNRDGLVDALLSLDTNHVYVVMQNATSGAPGVPQLVSLTPMRSMSVNLFNLFDRCARPWVYGVNANNGDGVAIQLDFGDDQSDCTFGTELNVTSITALNPIPLIRDAEIYSAATDLTGNCAAEIVMARRRVDGLTTEYYSISGVDPKTAVMTAAADVSSAARFRFAVPSGFGRPTFADWNGDGGADALFPACLDDNFVPLVGPCGAFNFLVVVLNEGLSLCSGDDCCSGGSGGQFVNVTESQQLNRTAGIMIFNLTTCASQQPNQPPTTAAIDVVIRDGDYNDDGILDAVMRTANGPVVLTGRGDDTVFDCVFLKVSNADGSETQLTSRYIDPFYFDIDDDGRLDLLTTITDVAQARLTGGGVYAFWGDAATLMNYYLTAMTINGAITPSGSNAWGANVVGATHRFQYIDINQNTHTATATQATSSAANALQQPRAHFGLAITFSYITNYATGYSLEGGIAKKGWPVYLMPNSQVVVIAAPNVDSDDWSLKLFLYGQRFMKLVLYAWMTSLAVIGLPLAILKIREIQADRRELHRHE